MTSADKPWTPPNDQSAEESVIGLCLRYARDGMALQLLDHVGPGDFYHPRNRKVFAAIVALSERDEPVDAEFVNGKLEAANNDEAGPELVRWLNRLDQGAAMAYKAPTYAKVVSDLAIKRRMLSVSTSIRDLAMSSGGAADVLREAEELLYSIASAGRASGSLRSLSDLVREQLEVIERRYENAGNGPVGVPTGLVDMDAKIHGLQPGALYVIGARPAMGKSALSMDFGTAVAKSGASVLAFSLEMRHGELVDRLLAANGRIPGDRIKTGSLTDDDWARLNMTAGRLADLPFDIDDDPRVTLPQIRSRARMVKSRRKGLGLIIVDYIQLMKGVGKAESRQREIADISQELKVLARELEVPVIALAQLNRTLESRADKRPMLSDLKDSGQLEQDADVVIFVYRDEVYDENSPDRGMAELIVAKQRSGATGTVRAAFRSECTTFENMAKTPALPSGMPALGAGYDGGSDHREF